MTRRQRQRGILSRLAAVILPTVAALANGRRRAARSMRLERLDRLSAAYDAAQTTTGNSRHWRNADLLSADAANAPEVRSTIRSRARYEAQESNSVAKGMVLTLANDTIGTGPRLQMLLRDKKANARIEATFSRWAQRIRLAEKLRTMRVAKAVDGEAFAMLTTRPVRTLDVSLDVRPFEADLVESPWLSDNLNERDGIRFDEFGEPREYHVYKQHPGDLLAGFNPFAGEWTDASSILHVYRCDRPGQHRGVSELAPALPLFALLRDYTLAVLHSARSAAKFTAVLETQSGARDDDGNSWDPEVDPFDVVDIDYDMLTSLPWGWKLNQFKAEQPTTTFEMFRNAIINEIARCLNMPFNVAAGNSSSYNYASGRLDHQVYHRSIDVEISQWEPCILDRIVEAWFDEALLIPGYLPPIEALPYIPHQWNWDGRDHVDPQKEANAQQMKVKSGTTHRAREYAIEGLDIDAEDEIAASGYNVSVAEYRRALFDAHFAATNGGGDGTGDDDAADETTDETDGDQSEEEKAAVAAAI